MQVAPRPFLEWPAAGSFRFGAALALPIFWRAAPQLPALQANLEHRPKLKVNLCGRLVPQWPWATLG